MEVRIAAVEAVVAGIQNEVSGMKTRLDSLFQKLEENDQNMKSAIDSNDIAMKKVLDDKFVQLEQGYVNMGDTVKNEMTKAIDGVRGELIAEHQKLYDQVMGDVIAQNGRIERIGNSSNAAGIQENLANGISSGNHDSSDGTLGSGCKARNGQAQIGNGIHEIGN